VNGQTGNGLAIFCAGIDIDRDRYGPRLTWIEKVRIYAANFQELPK
jgi:hypothetical protein